MRDSTVLIVGSGGREHALAWALARSPRVSRVFVAPGNAGTTWAAGSDRAEAVTVPIPVEDIPALVAFAAAENIDLTVIGPEAPLAAGIVDAFQSVGLRVFGPTKAAAQLEASKTFAKDFMGRHNIPTAAYGSFSDYEEARDFVESFGRPVVVKADGLAAGKGVIMCDDTAQADDALRQILLDRAFGASGASVVVEERLDGIEMSVLGLCDGHDVVMLPFSRDHKRVGDGDTGPNTGGMGAVAPVDADAAKALGGWLGDQSLTDRIYQDVMLPVVRGMAAEGTPFVGVLFAGLMLSEAGPKVLEYNARFGDPETETVLPLLKSDLFDLLWGCTEGAVPPVEIAPGACATVVMASPGYPADYPKGLPISGLTNAPDGVLVFHAGTAAKDGQVVTSGGRVLAVSAVGETLDAALEQAYAHLPNIQFEGAHYRRDIGRWQAEGVNR